MRVIDRTGMNTEDFLWYLYNDLGCKDLAMCTGYVRTKDGLPGFGKRVRYDEICHLDQKEVVPTLLPNKITRDWFMKKIWHRTILDIELMFELDEPGPFKTIRERSKVVYEMLKSDGYKPIVYYTWSKSYHISCLDYKFREMSYYHRLKEKQRILEKYGCDIQNASDKTTIAFEGAPHYRSGRIKSKVIL